MANGRYNLSDNNDFKIRKVIKSLKSSPIRNVANSVIGKENIIPLYFGETDIFIKPNYNFKIVDALLTNFHLPKSSLIMLVSAFAGTEQILNAYKHAVKSKYLFYSYGDAMLVFPKK